LKLRDLDQEYEGNVEVDLSTTFQINLGDFLPNLEISYDGYFHVQATGEDFSVEPADGRRPFRALLDVGLIRTTTGNRVFGALKVFNN
jgi:hypothetical protein